MTARKVMLLGEIGVGKSSLARRLTFDKFDIDYKPTIGVDVYRYEVPATTERAAMSLIIWDTDGNFGDAIFKHIYMKQAAAALIIGDIARPSTLTTMARLADGFAESFPGRHVGFIVNKSDLVPEPESIPLPGALALPGRAIICTSAKTGHHVKRAFIDAADCIARRSL
jgi:small GTP-binding protein